MSFLTQTWQVLVNFLNLCWPIEEPIFAVKTPEPNVFLNRIDQIDSVQSSTHSTPSNPLSNPSTQSTPSTPSTLSTPCTPPLSTQNSNDSLQMRLQIPAFEPSEIGQNSNLLIIGPKMTGKTTLVQTIIRDIRDQYLETSSKNQNCEAVATTSLSGHSPSSNTRILIITNELRDWSKDQPSGLRKANCEAVDQPSGLRKANCEAVDLGVPVTVMNSCNAQFVQKIKFFVSDYLIERELNDTCQAVVVFDETLTSELFKYPVIYNLLTSHQLNVIIINQQMTNFPSSFFKQIDYYLLAGAQLSSTLKMPIWNDVLREQVPEDIVKYFELFQVGRFLTINNDGYGWIDSEIESI